MASTPLSFPKKTYGTLDKYVSCSQAKNVVGFTLVELLFYIFFLSLVVAAVVQSSRSVITASTHFLSYNRENSTNQYVFQLLRNWLSEVGRYSSLSAARSTTTKSETYLSQSTLLAANAVLTPGAFGTNGQCINRRDKVIAAANVGSCENGHYDRLVVGIQSNRDCKGSISSDRIKNLPYQIYDFYVDDKNQLICQNYNVRRLSNGETDVKTHRVLAKRVTQFDVIYLLKEANNQYSAMKASDIEPSKVSCIRGVSIVLTITNNDVATNYEKKQNTSTAIIERLSNIKGC